MKWGYNSFIHPHCSQLKDKWNVIKKNYTPHTLLNIVLTFFIYFLSYTKEYSFNFIILVIFWHCTSLLACFIRFLCSLFTNILLNFFPCYCYYHRQTFSRCFFILNTIAYMLFCCIFDICILLLKTPTDTHAYIHSQII